MLKRSSGLRALGFGRLLRPLRLLVVAIVVADLEADVILLRSHRGRNRHGARVGFLPLQGF